MNHSIIILVIISGLIAICLIYILTYIINEIYYKIYLPGEKTLSDLDKLILDLPPLSDLDKSIIDMTCRDLVRKYIPNADDELCNKILFDQTCFPFGNIDKVDRQIKEYVKIKKLR